MKLVTTPEAVEYVRERGGTLFVWSEQALSYTGQLTYLEASTESPSAWREFRPMRGDAFELFVDFGGRDLPDELHVGVFGRRKKRLRAFWNGCSFAREAPTT
ncbi:MAG TPA: hypothetical protein VJN50_08405 [Actinomycetota bacterium]|nr:hypothetical protein [Actinomycetota bacterium]